MSIIEKAMEKLGGNPDQPQESELQQNEEEIFAATQEAAESVTESQFTPNKVVEGADIEIDLEKLNARGILDPREDPRSNRIAEEFRRIKRPLLMHILGKGASQVERANLIMVTSSIAGEGKTFTAINLALSVAMEMDKTVLLVDADIAKPEIMTRMAVADKKGLTDVLLGECQLKDVLLKSNIPSLSVLPAGKRHTHATELLASKNMSLLLDELSTRYSDRIVIFDSPPLMLTSEARVLASQMGQILLVVEESRTPQRIVTESLSTLDSSEIVGLVLNKSHRGDGTQYGYAYGYGYGR